MIYSYSLVSYYGLIYFVLTLCLLPGKWWGDVDDAYLLGCYGDACTSEASTHARLAPCIFLGCEYHLQNEKCPTSLSFCSSSPCIRVNWCFICYWFVNTKSKLLLWFFLLLRIAVWPGQATSSQRIWSRVLGPTCYGRRPCSRAPLDQNRYSFLPLFGFTHILPHGLMD